MPTVTSTLTISYNKDKASFCFFPPVAQLVRPSILQLKLRSQLIRQSQLIPPAPISYYSAKNGLMTHWLTSEIEDKLYEEMCETEIEDPNRPGDTISKYYIEAAKYAGRISVGNFEGENAKFKPVFEIHHKDFTTRLQEELKLLHKTSPATVHKIVQNAAFIIFRSRHKRIFFEYIQSEGLNWRFVTTK